MLADDEVSKLARDVNDSSQEVEQATNRNILSSVETFELLVWLSDYSKASADSAPNDLRKFRVRSRPRNPRFCPAIASGTRAASQGTLRVAFPPTISAGELSGNRRAANDHDKSDD